MTAADVTKKSLQFKRLCRELPNLELNSDKMCHRKGDESNQMILSSTLKPLVFKELCVDMGHLGYDRTLELICSLVPFGPKGMSVLNISLPKFVNASKVKQQTLFPRHHSRPSHLLHPWSLLV